VGALGTNIICQVQHIIVMNYQKYPKYQKHLICGIAIGAALP
jgi:hypothetical protein